MLLSADTINVFHHWTR